MTPVTRHPHLTRTLEVIGSEPPLTDKMFGLSDEDDDENGAL